MTVDRVPAPSALPLLRRPVARHRPRTGKEFARDTIGMNRESRALNVLQSLGTDVLINQSEFLPIGFFITAPRAPPPQYRRQGLCAQSSAAARICDLRRLQRSYPENRESRSTPCRWRGRIRPCIGVPHADYCDASPPCWSHQGTPISPSLAGVLHSGLTEGSPSQNAVARFRSSTNVPRNAMGKVSEEYFAGYLRRRFTAK